MARRADIMRTMLSIFALLVAACGWYYLFYSRAAERLEGIEENRANRVRALVVALYEMQPDNIGLNITKDEADNIRANLLNVALDESRELLRAIGQRGAK